VTGFPALAFRRFTSLEVRISTHNR
jgi:hypothetical protein